VSTFVYTTYVHSTREQIWAALTGPEFTARYWNGRLVESDWQVGSPVVLRHDYDDGVDVTGEVLVADHPRRLSYTWPPTDSVTFELTELDDVVRLDVTHTGLDDTTARQITGGWSFILANLKTLLETGAPLPMPPKTLTPHR
jgi:uncharacterized protein YndB with AHSA1/START domain